MRQIYGDRPGWHSMHAFASAEFQIMKKKKRSRMDVTRWDLVEGGGSQPWGSRCSWFLRVWVRGMADKGARICRSDGFQLEKSSLWATDRPL